MAAPSRRPSKGLDFFNNQYLRAQSTRPPASPDRPRQVAITNVHQQHKGTGNTPFHTHALANDIPSTIELLKTNSTDLFLKNKLGDTALHTALRQGHSDLARVLVESGADVYAKGQRGETVMHLCARKGLFAELDLFADAPYNVPVDARADGGVSPIHLAAQQDRNNTLRWFAGRGARLDLEDDEGDTPLHYAAREGSLGAVMFLLDQDPSLSGRTNKMGKDASHLAKDNGRLEVAKYFRLRQETLRRAKQTTTEILRCARNGLMQDVMRMLDETTVDAKDPRKGTNALLEACAGGHVEIVRQLLSFPGTRDFINSKTGSTALHLAAASGNIELVELLLQRGMDASRKDGKNETPLDIATRLHHTHIAEALEMWALNHRRLASPAPAWPPVVPVSSATSTSQEESPRVLRRDTSELSAFLDELGLQEWTAPLAALGFDSLATLLHLYENDLIQMKMPVGHKRALLSKIDSIRMSQASKGALTPSSAELNKLPRNFSFVSMGNAKDDFRIIAKIPQSSRGPFPEIETGEAVEVESQNGVWMVLRRTGPTTYRCTCPEFRTAGKGLTCDHVEKLLGSEKNQARLALHGQEHIEERAALQQRTSAPQGEIASHFLLDEDEIKYERIIGEGSFGVVWSGTWRGSRVAVKKLKLGHDPARSVEAECNNLKRESLVMSRVCNHAHVVPFMGMILGPHPSVVTALMVGSVEELAVLTGTRSIRFKLNWGHLLAILRDAASGVSHLHLSQVIHRDLSARNFLIDDRGNVRVSDFGFAKTRENNVSRGFTNSNVGPIKWMSPESLLSREFNEKSDVFAFAVFAWELMSGEMPWADIDVVQVIVRVCERGARLPRPATCPNEMWDLIQGMWRADSAERPDMQAVLDCIETWAAAYDESPTLGDLIRTYLPPVNGGSTAARREPGDYDQW